MIWLTTLLVVIASGASVAYGAPVRIQTLKNNQTQTIVLRTESPR